MGDGVIPGRDNGELHPSTFQLCLQRGKQELARVN